MKAPLFDEILDICKNIAQASSEGNDDARELHYKNLISLCAKHEDSPRDHPLQWEALADFTNDSEQAIDIYEKAIEIAQEKQLPNSQASIYLALSSRFQEIEELDKCVETINKAHDLLGDVDNEELKNEIVELFNALNK